MVIIMKIRICLSKKMKHLTNSGPETGLVRRAILFSLLKRKKNMAPRNVPVTPNS